MSISTELQQKVDDYSSKFFKKLTIGIQIRTKKHFKGLGKPRPETFFQVAKLIQQKYGAADNETSFFLTTDDESKLETAKSVLGENVWHTQILPRRTVTGDLMAVVDLKLLSMCNEVVITHGSSFGQIAAALSRTLAFSVAAGDTYWGAAISEPCYWNVRTALSVPHIREKHAPILLHHLLCHPDIEVYGD